MSPSKEYLSLLKSEWPEEAEASHDVGHVGELCDGQRRSPSAGYGSCPCGPWWWQCGSESRSTCRGT